MSPPLLRAFLKLLLWGLGMLAAAWACAIPMYFMSDKGLMQFIGLSLWWLAFACIVVALVLLSVYGITSLLPGLVDKVSVQPADESVVGTDALAKSIGTTIANSLTRYQSKRTPTAQHANLTISLLAFESALQRKLPEAALTQRSWWTDASGHSRQWLAQGWQVLDAKLTAPNLHIVFGPLAVQPPYSRM